MVGVWLRVETRISSAIAERRMASRCHVATLCGLELARANHLQKVPRPVKKTLNDSEFKSKCGMASCCRLGWFVWRCQEAEARAIKATDDLAEVQFSKVSVQVSLSSYASPHRDIDMLPLHPNRSDKQQRHLFGQTHGNVALQSQMDEMHRRYRGEIDDLQRRYPE